MGRLPNDEYYPKEWKENQPYVHKHEDISLNSDRVTQGDMATPFSISPQISEFTRKFGEELAEMPTADEMAQWHIDWDKEYREGTSFFVPENRYTHEAITPPQHISDNIYRLNLSPDIYIKIINSEIVFNSKKHYVNEYKFISRTLYTHLEATNNIIEDESKWDIWCPRIYQWHVRWLPKDDATLTFFIDKDIQDMLYCNVEEYSVNTKDIEGGYVSIPVTFKKGLKKKMAYMKHDIPYLYVKVDLL
jgi:hypothetical protein